MNQHPTDPYEDFDDDEFGDRCLDAWDDGELCDPLDEALRMDLDEQDLRNHAFADPGGNSALRAASKRNPRNLPCPTCGEPNRLTPADRARGYQCDRCADRAERGWDGY